MPRRHDIDALRVLAFALLILYHTAMAYVDGWGFHLKSDYTAEWLQWPMLLVNRWRMQLLFLLSGIAIALMRPEVHIARFAVLRTWRLLLPLLFGMFVVVPIQPYAEALTNGRIEPGFGAFLLRYWQMPAWPQDTFAGWQLRITWNHLWYLAYLWVYTLLLALLMPVLETPAVRRAVERYARAPAPMLIGLPSLLSFGWVAWLDPRFPSTNLLFGDWYQHAKYGTVFLAGYLLARATPFWARVVELRRLTLGVAVFAACWYFGIRILGRVLPADSMLRQWPDSIWTVQVMASQSLYLWAVLLTLLGWAKVYLDRPFRWLPYCTEAVYPWYILHQSLIIALLFGLKPLHLGPWWEPLLVLAGTVAGCLLLNEVLIRRIGWLRPLFGLRRQRRALSVTQAVPQD